MAAFALGGGLGGGGNGIAPGAKSTGKSLWCKVPECDHTFSMGESGGGFPEAGAWTLSYRDWQIGMAHPLEKTLQASVQEFEGARERWGEKWG